MRVSLFRFACALLTLVAVCFPDDFALNKNSISGCRKPEMDAWNPSACELATSGNPFQVGPKKLKSLSNLSMFWFIRLPFNKGYIYLLHQKPP